MFMFRVLSLLARQDDMLQRKPPFTHTLSLDLPSCIVKSEEETRKNSYYSYSLIISFFHYYFADLKHYGNER